MERKNELLGKLRLIPLEERLNACRVLVAKMCSEARPPRMTIPVRWDDEDFFICNTVKDAVEMLKYLS